MSFLGNANKNEMEYTFLGTRNLIFKTGNNIKVTEGLHPQKDREMLEPFVGKS
jgi:hypothetical protein